MNDIEKRIEELTNELNYHNHKYYVVKFITTCLC